jgi:hypothetical protein
MLGILYLKIGKICRKKSRSRKSEAASKTDWRAIRFHWFVLEWIKFEIKPIGKSLLFRNFGCGVKEGSVGTQAVVQIGKFEEIDTWRQAPAISKGLHFWIPYHSQEAEGAVGAEKKFL